MINTRYTQTREKQQQCRSDLLGAELETRAFYEDKDWLFFNPDTWCFVHFADALHSFRHDPVFLFYSLSFFHLSQKPDVVRKTDFEKRELVFFRSKQQDNLELSIKLDLIWKRKKNTSARNHTNRNHSDDDGLVERWVESNRPKVKGWIIICNHPTTVWRKSIHCLAIKTTSFNLSVYQKKYIDLLQK